MAAFRGSCLCGEVAFEVEGPFDSFLNCHCSRCRKATGTARAKLCDGVLREMRQPHAALHAQRPRGDRSCRKFR